MAAKEYTVKVPEGWFVRLGSVLLLLVLLLLALPYYLTFWNSVMSANELSRARVAAEVQEIKRGADCVDTCEQCSQRLWKPSKEGE